MRRRLLEVLIPALFAAGAAGAAEELVDGIAAQVGSEIVLVSEVMHASRSMANQMKASGAPESEIAKVRASALEELIESHLLARVVKQSELVASDADIDGAIEGIAKENGLTVEQLQASVTSHDITYKEYREQIKHEIERRKVVQTMIASRVHLEEDDLKRLYAERFSKQPAGGETVHVRQILVVFGPETGRELPEACRIARAGEARIRQGTPFEAVAREISAVAPMDGGDIGWIHGDSMAPWMKEALAPLEPGGVTGVLQLPFGCGLMQLIERREWTPVSYEAAKPMLEQQAFEEKVAAEYRTWMDQLRANSYIERRGYFAEAAKLGAGSLGGEQEGETATEGTGTP
jgi:peptidyl-prolyl cis-trans isomerase SurA